MLYSGKSILMRLLLSELIEKLGKGWRIKLNVLQNELLGLLEKFLDGTEMGHKIQVERMEETMRYLLAIPLLLWITWFPPKHEGDDFWE